MAALRVPVPWNSLNKVIFQCLKIWQLCKMQIEKHIIVLLICRTEEYLRGCQNTPSVATDREGQPWLARGGHLPRALCLERLERASANCLMIHQRSWPPPLPRAPWNCCYCLFLTAATSAAQGTMPGQQWCSALCFGQTKAMPGNQNSHGAGWRQWDRALHMGMAEVTLLTDVSVGSATS